MKFTNKNMAYLIQEHKEIIRESRDSIATIKENRKQTLLSFGHREIRLISERDNEVDEEEIILFLPADVTLPEEIEKGDYWHYSYGRHQEGRAALERWLEENPPVVTDGWQTKV